MTVLSRLSYLQHGNLHSWKDGLYIEMQPRSLKILCLSRIPQVAADVSWVPPAISKHRCHGDHFCPCCVTVVPQDVWLLVAGIPRPRKPHLRSQRNQPSQRRTTWKLSWKVIYKDENCVCQKLTICIEQWDIQSCGILKLSCFNLPMS